MNKILMLVGIAIAVVAVWLLLDRDDTKKTSAAPAAATGTASGTSGSANTPKRAPVVKVGRVSPEERTRLAEQIARAKAKRAAPATGGASSGGTPRPELAANEDANIVRTTMKEAMREVIPFLADCYDKAGDKVPAEISVVVEMTLTGDPDIGTIIDTNGVAEKGGSPLETSFDSCLRDALASLQMPPLSEGGEVQVRYPFVFARSDSDAPAGSGTLPP
ncbi:MAG: hypothetical protein ACKV2T_26980 [Kofleriaceae bacterium]